MNYKGFLQKSFITSVVVATVIIGGSNLIQTDAQTPNISKSPQIKPTFTLKGHIWDIEALAFSPDGQTLISGSFDHTVKMWNLINGRLITTLDGHKDGVNDVVISADGQLFFTGGGTAQTNTDKVIKVWSMKTRKLLRTLKGHSQGVTSLAITADGKTLVSGSYDNTIKLWNPQTGALIRTLAGHNSPVRSVAISPDGKTLASGGGSLKGDSDKTLRLWNLETGKLISSIEGNTNLISFIGFTPDGKYLVNATDPRINVWDLNTGKLVNTFSVSDIEGITSVTLGNDSKSVVTTTLDGAVTMWDLSTGKAINSFLEAANNPQNYDQLYPTSTAFSPDGKIIAIGKGGGAYNSTFPISIQKMP
ncbi:MAG: WD40 repeat domain-containing protein [Rivularia sp. T60_A2020_040]|nr:WD40 repeat domain-containing protein [Rivularia sp. T60_A2020_040]